MCLCVLLITNGALLFSLREDWVTGPGELCFSLELLTALEMQAFANYEWYNLSVHTRAQMSIFLNAQHPKAADVFSLITKNVITNSPRKKERTAHVSPVDLFEILPLNK